MQESEKPLETKIAANTVEFEYVEEDNKSKKTKKSALGDYDSIKNTALNINVPETIAQEAQRAAKVDSAFAIRHPSAYLTREKSNLFNFQFLF